MDGIADTARDNVWDKSGMELIPNICESKEETAYKNIKVDFSFYLFTRLSDDNDDYLLAATDNEIITTSQISYGFNVSSIIKANESTNDNVQRTYIYLNETEQINVKFESWSYQKKVYYWFVFLGDHS